MHKLWIMVFISISFASVYGEEGELSTVIKYKIGSPILLHLNYPGGIKNWDAGASISKGILVLSNDMFISVTDSKNVNIKPIAEKVLSVWADTYFRNPFELEIDISKFYNLSQSGKYLLRWGCRDVKEERLFIEITE